MKAGGSKRVRSQVIIVSLFAVSLLAVLGVGLKQEELRHDSSVLRVMPLGDSITEGAPKHPSYRHYLCDAMRERDHPVVFVGSSARGSVPDSLCPRHEGHWGWTARQLAMRAEGWTRNARPDVVLLLAGTNDVNMTRDTGVAIENVGELVRVVHEAAPDAPIMVSTIPPIVDVRGDLSIAFNAELPELVDRLRGEGIDASFVDAGAKLTTNDLYDGLHPNDTGARKISDVFANALEVSADTTNMRTNRRL